MGFVRLNLIRPKYWVFVIFWVRIPQLASKMTKKCDFRLNFDVFVCFFRQCCSNLFDFGNPESFFPNEKKYSNVSNFCL